MLPSDLGNQLPQTELSKNKSVVNSKRTFAIVFFLLAAQTCYSPGTQIISNGLLDVFVNAFTLSLSNVLQQIQ